jgi:hypothetical protein
MSDFEARDITVEHVEFRVQGSVRIDPNRRGDGLALKKQGF